jgi:orotate phosphoribosyltransferase
MTTNLFQLGNFILNSGKTSKFKLECDALKKKDWEALAYMIWQMVGVFDGVEGVPTGGLKLAKALEKYSCRNPKDPDLIVLGGVNPIPHLIVDDVLTTGNSIRKAGSEWSNKSGKPYPIWIGAVVFARGECPAGTQALFQMPKELWLNRE